MSPPLLLFSKPKDGVVVVTLNRPDSRNALGDAGDGEAFAHAREQINKDKSIRCVILTGAGTAFSAGGNVKAMRDGTGSFTGHAVDIAQGYRQGIHRIVRSLWKINVPVIAAVNGPAVGLGNDIACLCDIRLAAKSARFGATFLKIGLIPGDGGAWLLPKIIGLSRASELLYTASLIDADKAQDWGLVSEVVADDQLMEHATAMARQIALQPPDVLRMAKKLLREGLTSSFDNVMELSAVMQALAHKTDDHKEAVDAFFARRPGNYKGH